MPAKSRQTITKTAAPAARAAVALLHVGTLSAGERPNELLLLKWGENHTREGLFIVNERTLACLDANQRLMNRTRVKGDFEHASVTENPADHPMHFGSDGQPAVIRGAGLKVLNVNWLPKGEEHVPGDYGDLSAAPFYDEATREVIGLHSYAHCRHAAADGASIADSVKTGLTALNASLATLSASLLNPNTPASNPMHKTLLSALLNALGVTVAETASDEEFTAAVETAKGKLPAPAPAAPPADAGVLATLSAAVTALTGEVKGLKEGAEKATKLAGFEKMLADGLNEGRLITLSAADLMALGDERAKAQIALCPPNTVPMERRTPALVTLAANPLNGGSVHPDELAAFRDLGQEHPSQKKA